MFWQGPESSLAPLARSRRAGGNAFRFHGPITASALAAQVALWRRVWPRQLGEHALTVRDGARRSRSRRTAIVLFGSIATASCRTVSACSIDPIASRIRLFLVCHERLAREIEGVRLLKLPVAVARRFVQVAPDVVRYSESAPVDRVLETALVVRGVVRVPRAADLADGRRLSSTSGTSATSRMSVNGTPVGRLLWAAVPARRHRCAARGEQRDRRDGDEHAGQRTRLGAGIRPPRPGRPATTAGGDGAAGPLERLAATRSRS